MDMFVVRFIGICVIMVSVTSLVKVSQSEMSNESKAIVLSTLLLLTLVAYLFAARVIPVN